MFGAERRRTLLSSNYAPLETGSLRLSVSPDHLEKVRVAARANVTRQGTLSAAQVSVGLTESGNDSVGHGRADLTVGEGKSGVYLSGVYVDGKRGLGVYALTPLASTLAMLRGDFSGPGVSNIVPASEAVGRSSLSSLAEMGEGLGRTGDGRLVGETEVRKLAKCRPEVGMVSTVADSRVAFGAHVSPTGTVPGKAWVIGRPSEGLLIGAQASTEFRSSTSSTSSPSAAPRKVHWDVGVGYEQPNLFEASLVYRGAMQEVVAGYTHSLTTRRTVRNPFEASHVKGIFSYVDFGFELRVPVDPHNTTSSPQIPTIPSSSTTTSSSPPTPSSPVSPPRAIPAMSLGASFQPNRVLLVKGKIGTHESAMSLIARSWGDPVFSVCASIGLTPNRNAVLEPKAGVFFSVQRNVKLEYRRAVQGRQRAAPTRVYEATPELSRDRDDDARPSKEAIAPFPSTPKSLSILDPN